MIFSSLTFVIFFALILFGLRTLPTDRARQWLLLLGSYIFYGWWDWQFLSLIVASSLWSYYFGLKIAAETDRSRQKRLLATTLSLDLGLLAYFKYANFFVGSFAAMFGIERAGVLEITLPVGISFFTFQTMSYTIDIFRGRIDTCRDPVRFFLFVSFFPQLVAGPIVRASEFLPQLERPVELRAANISKGAQIFVLGLFQKILVADNLAAFVDPVFAHPEVYDSATLWLGLAGYTLQIFCDFSGYSLMAIGVAKVMGFDLPENFRTPYLSRSITEFWRRWHMSLSFWLRDYLYISLGGNRKGKWRTDFNLMATMVLGGLWHGAGWNFVIWGFAHGAALMVHKHYRTLGWKPPERFRDAWSVVSWAITLLFCAWLWIPFRAQDFSTTWAFFSGLFGQAGIHWIQPKVVILVLMMTAWHALFIKPNRLRAQLPSARPWDPVPMLGLATMLFAILMFAPFEASPFIYFQF